MLDKLPADILAELASWLGEQPHSFHRVCRSTWRISNDDRALLLWLLRIADAGGNSSALLLLVSVHCVARWDEARVLRAVQQLLDAGCTVSEGAQFGCLLTHLVKRGFPAVLASLLERAATGAGGVQQSCPKQQLSLWVNNLLKLSAAQGHEGCVRVLLAQGADPNLDGGRPLKAACEAGSAGAVQALLDAGADIHAGGDCALRLCAAAGSPQHCAVMDLLLARGADVHAKHDEALSLAVERSNVEAVALLLRHGACATARQVLETAAGTGCARVVRLLLAAGAQPDADGGRPLRAAAQAGAVEVVHQLLDAGARVRRPSRRSLGGRAPPVSLSRVSLDGVKQPDRGTQGQPYAAALQASGAGWQGHAIGSWPAPRASAATSSLQPGSFTSGHHSWSSHGTSGFVPGQVMGGHDSSDVLRWEQLCQRESPLRGQPQPRGSNTGSIEESHLYEGWEEEGGDELGGECGPDVEADDEEFSGALCAALCAGEGEVVRVLLERGAVLSNAVLRCWRQWHRFPGIMAVLQRHSPFQLTGSQPGGRQLGQGPALRHVGCLGCSTQAGPSETLPAVGVKHPAAPYAAGLNSGPPLAQHLPSNQRWAPCSSAQPYAATLLVQQLEKELIAACSEAYAEAAVRLFLHWGAPVQVSWPCGSQQARQVEAEPGSCTRITPGQQEPSPNAAQASVAATMSASGPAACLHSSRPASSPVLGVFREATLARALHAAVSANHVAVVREVLQHRSSDQWRAATLTPVVLHTAVSEGFIEVVRVLLAAGAGNVALQAPGVSPPPSRTGPPPHTRTPAPASTGWAAVFSLVTQPQPLHQAGASTALDAAPPPPLQSESWGAAVLCAAAGCKRCSKVATAMVALLLEHGFGRCARDALRLVATGRVPAWSDEVAAVVLQAAFS